MGKHVDVVYWNRKHWGWSERAERLYALTFHAEYKGNRLSNRRNSDFSRERARWYYAWSAKLLKRLNELPPAERGEYPGWE